jgi:hypothetical protein
MKKALLNYFRTKVPRTHPRMRAYNLIKFSTEDGRHYESLSNIVDISENGLKFTCYEELPIHSTLQMKIAVPHKNHEISLVGQLMWTRKMRHHRGVFLAGVSFVKISEENRGVIREMVEEYLRDCKKEIKP